MHTSKMALPRRVGVGLGLRLGLGLGQSAPVIVLLLPLKPILPLRKQRFSRTRSGLKQVKRKARMAGELPHGSTRLESPG